MWEKDKGVCLKVGPTVPLLTLQLTFHKHLQSAFVFLLKYVPFLVFWFNLSPQKSRKRKIEREKNGASLKLQLVFGYLFNQKRERTELTEDKVRSVRKNQSHFPCYFPPSLKHRITTSIAFAFAFTSWGSEDLLFNDGHDLQAHNVECASSGAGASIFTDCFCYSFCFLWLKGYHH